LPALPPQHVDSDEASPPQPAETRGRRADANLVCEGRKVEVAGLVLVRQKPGSAKGVMFLTIEDETGIANLVIWPSLFETQRR
jgi:error-prone DNA polymerase